MTIRVKALVCFVVLGGMVAFLSTLGHPPQRWSHFALYLIAILLSSGMKVSLPQAEGTMSVNFPFILLGVVQLSPSQAVGLAVCSVIAQSNFKVIKPFTLIQTLFNVANVAMATVLAGQTFLWLGRLHLQMAPALAIASLVYFLANSLPVTFIIAWESGLTVPAQWRKEFLWYVPFYLTGAALAAAAQLISASFGWLTSLLMIPLVYTIYRAYTAQLAIVRDREQHIIENEALQLRTIEGLAMAIEAKDQNTHEHLMRVRVYVSELGRLLGLDVAMMQALVTASFLHDIGKLAVPEHIINKPGRLTPEEFEKMKIHPVVGADILERVRFPYPVVPIVRSHHESWDGSGYPDGLSGKEIPIGARILSVVDCFDALASDRPYRKALSLADAMAHVKGRAGIQFDPEVVTLLEQSYEKLEKQAREQIATIEPLKTDLVVHRGAAPGAGFAADEWPQSPARCMEVRGLRQGGPSPIAAVPALSLVASAGQEAKAVFELTQILGSSFSARETSAMMSRRLLPLVPYHCLAVYLKAGDRLELQHVDGVCAHQFSPAPLTIGEGLSGWVAMSNRPIANGNPTVETNFVADRAGITDQGSALAIPLIDLRGAVFGVLALYSMKAAAYSKDHLRMLLAVESKFSLALQNAMRFKLEEEDTRLDYLTRLPDMRTFLELADEAVDRAKAARQHFSVAVCELNSLRAVNDHHGHLMGNKMIRLIADRLRSVFRSEDIVAETGGGEFVILLPSMDMQSAHRRLGMLEAVVQRTCCELSVEIPVSTSVGMAFYPEDGATVEELLGTAERRMHLQKQICHESPRNTGFTARPESLASA